MLLLILLTHFNGGGSARFPPIPPVTPVMERISDTDGGSDGGGKELENEEDELMAILNSFLICLN
jgi:hypothetical protein